MLEYRYERAHRGEQKRLKRPLVPGPTGTCALCARDFPAAFLIAAHIQKRCSCTDDEKRDLGNLAMLARLFGCDGLYERGLISVSHGGAIQVSPLAASATAVEQHIKDHLAGKATTWWTPTREKSFACHRAHTYRAAVKP